MAWRRMRARSSSTALVLLVVAGMACHPRESAHETQPASQTKATEPEDTGEVIATYGGQTLRAGALTKELERMPGPSRLYLSSPERKRQFVENLVMNDLLFAEGQKTGLDRDPEVEAQVNELRKRLVVQRVMRQYQTPPTVTDEQVQAYYDANPDLYSRTQIRASHILVKDEGQAKELLAQLRADPSRFAALAREKSTDTSSGAKGGDLGTFGQGRMVPDFERAAFKLKVGEISDVVKTQYGYHIIMVTERVEGDRKPFDQVKEQIRATLRNQILQDRVQGYMERLKQEANLKINDDALARVNPPPTPSTLPTPGPPGMPPAH